ncbi:MAG: MATE family efflux transporter, partial [Ezakiella massiliensis]
MKKENVLATEPISKLLFKFALPSVIAMIVGAFYNIVDQIYIGNSVGVVGNSATNVSFPLTTMCIGLSLLIGIGAAARFNLSLGEKKEEEAGKYMGSGFLMIIISGLLLTVLV